MSKMLTGSRDRSSRFLQDDRFLSRLLSRERYNSGKQGEASFRVLYYGGATGSVPFVWESAPGTPKHHSAHSAAAAPLTPPPSYSGNDAPPPSRRSKSKVPPGNSRSGGFGSVIWRSVAPSKKMFALSPSPSTSSFSSAASCDARRGDGGASPTSTLCFVRPRGYGSQLKKAVRAIVVGR
ncbi:uncharacterized protein LOC127259861 [Andrographis paniculata]|uniref:uncharacterized protein LOC127259861 n=1 Tax=Andrographis paniculata TaxID=175694 RepID=UPI0021E7CE05|nr:uncharacterized protein LOC127259861 [Andrographis paniculata]